MICGKGGMSWSEHTRPPGITNDHLPSSPPAMARTSSTTETICVKFYITVHFSFNSKLLKPLGNYLIEIECSFKTNMMNVKFVSLEVFTRVEFN